VLIAAAGLLALAGTGALWAYVAGADARALAGKEAVEVLVAADAIPQGASFEQAQQQKLVTTDRFPRDAVPTDVFTDPSQLAGLVATRAVEPHELLTRTTFGPPSAGPETGGLAVPAGKVALPLSLKHFVNSADWATYLRPGAEIAVFETFTSAAPPPQPATPRGDGLALDKDSTQVTRLLVSRVPVIAVAGAQDSGDAGAAGKAVVLAVDQRQAEEIILDLSGGVVLYPVLLTDEDVVAPSPGTDNHRILEPTRSAS
jgi:pilus assembly protein CpaB